MEELSKLVDSEKGSCLTNPLLRKIIKLLSKAHPSDISRPFISELLHLIVETLNQEDSDERSLSNKELALEVELQPFKIYLTMYYFPNHDKL